MSLIEAEAVCALETDLPQTFAAASGDILAAVLDQSQDCIKLVSPDGQLLYMNRNGRCAMEIDNFDLVAGRLWWDLWPGEARDQVRRAVEQARQGRSDRFEAFCPTAKGSARWWEVTTSPVYGTGGELMAVVSVSRDVSERVRAAELRAAATDEMSHRLRNAFTLAGSIMHAAARGNADRSAFAGEVLARLSQLSIAQSLLLDPNRLGGIDLATLLERLVDPLCNGSCAIQIGDVPPVDLDEEDVSAIALVIGELATNSSKYGAIGHGGSVALSALVEDGQLLLRWSERSQAQSTGDGAGGNGMRLIKRALAARGGTATFTWTDHGPDVTISLPAA